MRPRFRETRGNSKTNIKFFRNALFFNMRAFLQNFDFFRLESFDMETVAPHDGLCKFLCPVSRPRDFELCSACLFPLVENEITDFVTMEKN